MQFWQGDSIAKERRLKNHLPTFWDALKRLAFDLSGSLALYLQLDQILPRCVMSCHIVEF
jgi:hypothetical protein